MQQQVNKWKREEKRGGEEGTREEGGEGRGEEERGLGKLTSGRETDRGGMEGEGEEKENFTYSPTHFPSSFSLVPGGQSHSQVLGLNTRPGAHLISEGQTQEQVEFLKTLGAGHLKGIQHWQNDQLGTKAASTAALFPIGPMSDFQ